MSDQHILIGKILMHFDEDQHCISRFTHDLGNSLLLAVRLIPSTGEELPLRHVVNLRDLTEDDQIFDDFESADTYYNKDDMERFGYHHTIQ